MKNKIFIVLVFVCFYAFPQAPKRMNSQNGSFKPVDTTKVKVAPIDLYRIITLDRDTTYIDTSLKGKLTTWALDGHTTVVK